ncbi:MAG: cation:proton antiporter, partial [Myxococcales bacterium]|nr:cation:proton antiporter [Myxococcales bacterium]
DAAAVFSVLAGAGLPERLKGVLEAESGTNDPMAIYLTLALTTMLTGGTVSVPGLVAGVLVQLGLGVLLGVAGGWALGRVIDGLRLEGSGLYPVLAVGGAVVVFAATNLVGGNGFLAIYVVGLVLAHVRVSHLLEIRTSTDTLAWAAQIGMFLLLGLLSFPDRLLAQALPATLLAVGMIVLARPVSVIASIRPLSRWFPEHRYTPDEVVLLSWAGLKGAVPIILATVPLLHGVPQGERIFDYVFVVVIVSTLVQGATTVPLAGVLGLLEPDPPAPPMTLRLGGDTPDGAEMQHVWLEAGVAGVGRTIAELGLAEGVVIAAVVRGGDLLPPRGGLTLLEGDHVFVLTVGGAGLPGVLVEPAR